MSGPRVAMIGGPPHAIRFARELGVDVVLVIDESARAGSAGDVAEKVIQAPFDDLTAVLDQVTALHRSRPFARVLSSSETGALVAAQVSRALGLPGNPVETPKRLRNKAATRQAMADHGLSPVRHRLIRGPDALAAFVSSVGGSVVVKPVSGTSSEEVHVVTDTTTSVACWERLRAAGYAQALAEEYLVGPVISAEAFSDDGRHVVVGLTDEGLNEEFVEVSLTAPSREARAYETELRELTARVLDAVGLRHGPSHTEFVLTAQGPRLLESHDRMAGGGIPELIRRAYGWDLTRMFLAVPLGLEALPDRPPTSIGGAAIRYLEPEPGIVTRIDGLDELDATVLRIPPGTPSPRVAGLGELASKQVGLMVQINKGDVVPRIRTGEDTRMGYAIASGRDADEAVARCEAILRSIRIHTRPVPGGRSPNG